MKQAESLRSAWLTTAVLATAVAASPVHAQQRLSLSERVDRLEQKANGPGGSGAVDLVNQISALQSQVQQLQGQVETLSHQLDEAKQRNKDQYIDLDSRIGRLEGHGSSGAAPAAPPPGVRENAQPPDIDLGSGRPVAPPPGTRDDVPTRARQNVGTLRDDERGNLDGAPPDQDDGGASPPAADAAGEQPAYDAAFAALKDGRYADSARKFQAFLDHYPGSGLASNAYYWLGESYYVTQNYKIALQSFQTLLQRYPDSAKAQDALLKVGYCQYELKQWDQAEATLNQVVESYPDTPAARLAQGRLRALRTESRR